MLYPAFSLYPHGAIMMCEDASEYDSNLPTPEEKEAAVIPVMKIGRAHV